MKTTKALLIFLMLFICGMAVAANAPSTFVTGFLHPKDWAFEENCGQLADPSGNALPEIKYFGSFGGVQIYCTSQKLSFVFTKTTQLQTIKSPAKKLQIGPITLPKSTISASRLDLEFEGANTDVTILSSEKQERTVNYATAHSGENGILGVAFYKTLTYKNLYHNIDMVVSADGTGLEYEFIVHPGGNANDIKLVRNGADNMKMLTNGGIRYATAFGTLEESKPQSFSNSKAINSSFIRKGNKLSFKTEEYDHTKDMVIDPGIVWSTYFGSDSDDESNSIAIDGSGNIYITGLTSGLSGIATKGAFQTSLAGGTNSDVFIAKFSGLGKLIWATYYGGDSVDVANGVAVDKSGNLYVTGNTLSSSRIATKGAYQTTSNISTSQSYTAFLAKFNNSGSLIWATYYGGDNLNESRRVVTDGSGNVYICGNTTSYSEIATKGAFHTQYEGGTMDGFIARFNSAGGLDWGTYFGGGGIDYCLGLTVDISKNIYVTGVTSSTNGIATSGANKTDVDVNAGNAFLASFDSTGAQKWGTYFGGNGRGDYGWAVSSNNNHVYIAGYTGNYTGVSSTGSYQSIFGGGNQDAFLASFSTTGSLSWATYYGGNGDDYAYGISSDTLENIYVTGYTSSPNQIATSGAFVTAIPGSIGSAFLAKFNSSGNFKYGTYYGGNLFEQGEGVANDNGGNVFITGLSVSSGIATAGAYQIFNAGGPPQAPFDAFLAKFILCDLTTSLSGLTTTCANSTTSYVASNHANSNYTWMVSGGTIASGNYTDSITVKWNGNGTGSVGEEELNSLTGCNDTKSLKVTIAALPVPTITGDTVVCPLNSSSYHVTPVSGASYTWNVTTGNISTQPGRDSIEVFWSAPGKGSVSINESIAEGTCKNGDTINITIATRPLAGAKITDNGKGNYKFASIDSSSASSGYSWNINGTKYTGYHIGKTFAHDSTYHVALSVTNSAGCTNTFDSTITVSDAGISQSNSGNMKWSIFPNPFKDQLEIKYSIIVPCLVEITVSDLLGRTMAILENGNLQPGNYTNTFDANTLNLTQGIYFLTLKANGGTETQRIVRIRD